jgi:hypothetical protein
MPWMTQIITMPFLRLRLQVGNESEMVRLYLLTDQLETCLNFYRICQMSVVNYFSDLQK